MSIISLNTVKYTVGAADTLEEKKLRPYYVSAERTLRRILGDTVFARIEAAAAAPTTDVPADNLIADYITGFLAWMTWGWSLPNLYAAPDRNGVHYKNDTNTVQAATGHLRDLMKVAGDMRGQYQSDLIAYLEKNSQPGQEWEDYHTDTGSANDDLMHSSRKTYGGVVTRKNVYQRPPR